MSESNSLRPDDDITVGGVKKDYGKLRWSLLPYDALGGIVVILGFGAKKYDDWNWIKGMDWSRPYDAAMRHMTAWWGGEENDPESGYSHLWHAATNIIFLMTYQLRNRGKDDRPSTRET